MTAFAREEHREAWGSAQWELRSVNNRYLDVSPKLPEDLRKLESDVRERIRARLGRGKVDCYLRVSYDVEAHGGFEIDLQLARRLAEASREVDALLHDPAPVSSIDVLRWPGVIRGTTVDLDRVARTVLDLLDQALTDLIASRRREGEKIAAMIEQRLDSMETIVGAVLERVPQILADTRNRLVARLAELTAELDPERLEQEVALLAQKSDVAEELDRLRAHMSEVRRVLGQSDPVGRRLDFLMQELNREANTLGSKSIDTESTRASVDLKVLIEQMREQVQNVE